MTDNVISCLIISYNEESNIDRVLDSVKWCSDVLIIDSGSQDRTVEIIKSYSNTRLLERKFDTFANQCNYGLANINSEWVLSLDADYIVPSPLKNEILTLVYDKPGYTTQLNQGFFIPLTYCINGKAIRSGLLPPRISLYRRRYARYIDIGHAHKVIIEGRVGRTNSSLLHDDRKSLWIWLSNQKRYQSIEAEMLRNTQSSLLPLQDRLRKHTWLAPFIVFFICILSRRGILDGKEGFVYAFQRLIAESLLYVELHIESNGIER
jgi:glycosyltransferase involved in cell wall biosynthesis